MVYLAFVLAVKGEFMTLYFTIGTSREPARPLLGQHSLHSRCVAACGIASFSLHRLPFSTGSETLDRSESRFSARL
jgi:hypothetical protein